MIDMDRYISLEELEQETTEHKGSYGYACQAYWKKEGAEGETVCLKRWHRDRGLLLRENQIRKEFNNMISFSKHSNIVTIIGIVKNQDNLAGIITEYACNGSLRNYLEQYGEHEEDGIERIKRKTYQWSKDIANAMEYLHSCFVVHMDLKSDNVVLDHDFNAQVCDFGLSTNFKRDEPMTYTDFPWKAPEVYKVETKANELRRARQCFTEDKVLSEMMQKCDIWAYGVVFWELLTLKNPVKAYPFSSSNQSEKIPSRLPLSEISLTSRNIERMKDLIDRCWSSDYSKRPNFCDIIRELRLVIYAYIFNHILLWCTLYFCNYLGYSEQGNLPR